MKFVILLVCIAVAANLSAACDCDFCFNDDCINFSDGSFTVRRRRLALDTMDETDSKSSETEMHEDMPEKECSPGAFFHEDCNSCFCTDEGKKNCSKKDCTESAPMEEETMHVDTSNHEKECSPGAFFYEDCNSCFCTDEGKKNCSKKDCKESVPMKEEEVTLHLDK